MCRGHLPPQPITSTTTLLPNVGPYECNVFFFAARHFSLFFFFAPLVYFTFYLADARLWFAKTPHHCSPQHASSIQWSLCHSRADTVVSSRQPASSPLSNIVFSTPPTAAVLFLCFFSSSIGAGRRNALALQLGSGIRCAVCSHPRAPRYRTPQGPLTNFTAQMSACAHGRFDISMHVQVAIASKASLFVKEIGQYLIFRGMMLVLLNKLCLL